MNENEFIFHLPDMGRLVLGEDHSPMVEPRNPSYAFTANRAPETDSWGGFGDKRENPTPIVITCILKSTTRLQGLIAKETLGKQLRTATHLEYQGFVTPISFARITQQQAVEYGWALSITVDPTGPSLKNPAGQEITL